jgi:hypothetical protein
VKGTTSKATITVKEGGVFKRLLPGSSSPVVVVGPSGSNNTAKIVLGAGAKLEASYTNGYLLTTQALAPSATATLAADLLLPPKLTIGADTELIVAAGKTLIVKGAIVVAPTVPAALVMGAAASSKITLRTGSRIVVIDGTESNPGDGDSGTGAFKTDAATGIWKVESGIVVPPYHTAPDTTQGILTTGPAEFVWDGTDTWVK